MCRLLGIAWLCVLSASICRAQSAWWELQNPKPRVTNLWDVAMLDTSSFLAVGDQGLILGTSNNGSSWHSQVLPTNFNRLSGIALSPSKQHGVILTDTGTVFFSTDRGSTWTPSPQHLPFRLRDVCFRTERDVYAVGTFGTILHSSDGGQRWERYIAEFTDLLQSIHFSDSLNGFIAARFGTYFITNDGGARWNRRTLPYDNSLSAIHAYDAGHVVTGGEVGGVFLTTDSTRNWQRQNSRTPYPIGGAVHLTQDTIIVCGDNYMLHSTTDGGTTWEDRLLVRYWENLKALSFYNTSYGVCVGTKGAMLRTTDAGLTWIRLTTNAAEYEMLRGVHCIDSFTAVAVGTVILVRLIGANNGIKYRALHDKPCVASISPIDRQALLQGTLAS